MNLSIKEVPEAWVEQLRGRAKAHRRSLQGELLTILEGVLKPKKLSLEEAEAQLQALNFHTPDQATRWIREERIAAKVPDASVLAAWAFREGQAKEAFDLMSDATLHVPTLAAYELMSIARKKILEAAAEKEAILQGLNRALHLDLHWMEVDPLPVMELSLEKSLSVYDASYLWLAKTLDAELLTFDKKLKSAARKT